MLRRQGADEATQQASKADIRKRVHQTRRTCRAVLLAAQPHHQHQVVWSSNPQQTPSSNADWIVHHDPSADPTLLGQHCARIDIWAAKDPSQDASEKGKQKAACQDSAIDASSWEWVLSHCVDLTQLSNLGSDVSLVPS